MTSILRMCEITSKPDFVVIIFFKLLLMTYLKIANSTKGWYLDQDNEPDVSGSQQITSNSGLFGFPSDFKDRYNRAIFFSLAMHLKEAENTSLLLILDLYLVLNLSWFLNAVLTVFLQCNISTRRQRRQTTAQIFPPWIEHICLWREIAVSQENANKWIF